MKFALLSIALLASVANAEVLSLTSETFDSATAGKNVFIKFFAPWCGHCKAMAPAWEQLAADYEGSKTTLIAEVDCTQEDDLCGTFEVRSFPTIQYGDVNDMDEYRGQRDYEALQAFAKENLETPICSIYNKDACEKDVQDAIAGLEKKSAAELKAIAEDFEKQAEEADAVLQAEIEKIEEAYDNAVEAHSVLMDKLRASTQYKHVMALIGTMEESDEAEF